GLMVILGVLVGVLVLLGLGCGAWALLHNSGNNAPAASGTTAATHKTTAAPRASATVPLVSARCEVVTKRPTIQQTRDFLEGEGFEVNREDVPGPRNRVVEVTPCQAPKGSTITVKVGNGQRASAPAGSAT